MVCISPIKNYGIFNVSTNKLLTNDELYYVNKEYHHWPENYHKGFPKIVYENIADDSFHSSQKEKVCNSVGNTSNRW